MATLRGGTKGPLNKLVTELVTSAERAGELAQLGTDAAKPAAAIA